MKRSGVPSWSVRCEGREELNFAIYVGCTYDLLPQRAPFSSARRWSSTIPLVELSQSEYELVAAQWSAWWDQLVSARELNQPRLQVYNPPTFSLLDSELGNLCRHTWQPFLSWWQMPAGGSVAMMHWESTDPVQLYIREFEDEVQRQVKPFRLEVDYVYAGLDHVIEVNPNYAIIPVRSPSEHRSWWKQKIRELG